MVRRAVRRLLLVSTAIHSCSAFVGHPLQDAISINKIGISSSNNHKMDLLQQTASHNTRSSYKPASTTKTALHMAGGGMEEFLYQTQNAASQLASLSLNSNDPGNLLASLPLLYAAGLLTSVSPCVWGLLPLTLSYISQAAGEREDQQTALPTLAFAAGLASVFCSLGVAAVELGGVFGAAGGGASGMLLPILSNAICLAMGFKLLDLVDLPLPSFEFLKSISGSGSMVGGRTKVSDEPILIDGTGQILTPEKDKDQTSEEGGSLLRTFLLGGSSALVASPCATPVLTSILAFVANASNPALGAFLLLGYTLGYATPLLLVAATGGQFLLDLRKGDKGSWYADLAPWVTPLTGGVLLWSGTNGMLTALLGDPSLAGLAVYY